MASTKPKPDYWLSTDGLLQIQSWASKGYTNLQIAAKIGISETVFYRWCKLKPHPEDTDVPFRKIGRYESFADFLAHARMSTDEVEASTKMAAMGYWIEEEYFNRKGEKKLVKRWIPPSDRARDLYLKNLKPNDWNKENEKQADTSALERLDSILKALTINAGVEPEEPIETENEVQEDNNL